LADFPYKQHWESDGQLEVFPESTDRTCSGKHSIAFFQFYRALRQSDSVTRVGDTLTLSWANMPLMRLQRFEPHGLEIRRWVIEKYLDERALRAPDTYVLNSSSAAGAATRPPTITFALGALTGSLGCGALGGDYQLAERSLLIHPETIVMGHCPAGSMLQDHRIEGAFRRVRQWDQEGRRMILRGDRGEIEAVLVE
jgi:heat shock protein HslJ